MYGSKRQLPLACTELCSIDRCGAAAHARRRRVAAAAEPAAGCWSRCLPAPASLSRCSAAVLPLLLVHHKEDFLGGCCFNVVAFLQLAACRLWLRGSTAPSLHQVPCLANAEKVQRIEGRCCSCCGSIRQCALRIMWQVHSRHTTNVNMQSGTTAVAECCSS